MQRVLVFAALAGCFAWPAAWPAPVGEALLRPAVRVKQPERAVLLAAAQAGKRLVAVGERGIVAVSQDQGRTWRQAASPVSVTLTAVRFSDESHGVAVGHGGVVLTSTDGGAIWQLRLDGRRLAGLLLDAARASGDAARLREAERLVSEGPDKPLLDVAVLAAQRFVVVGAYGLAVATEDGGKTWASWMDRLDNPKGLHLYVARASGDQLLLAGEQGLVLRSADGGASFKRVASPYKGSWFAGELRGAAEVVLAGLRGNVWRTADAGASWRQLGNPSPASITAIARAGDALLLANQAGLVSRLQGDALVPVNPSPLPPVHGLLVAGPQVLALGVAGVMPVGPAEKAQ